MELAEAQRLVEAATHGEWRIDHDRNDQPNIYAADEWIAILPHQCVTSIEEQRNRDAAFIAASRSLVPALIAEVTRLRTLLVRACSSLECEGLDETAAEILKEAM